MRTRRCTNVETSVFRRTVGSKKAFRRTYEKRTRRQPAERERNSKVALISAAFLFISLKIRRIIDRKFAATRSVVRRSEQPIRASSARCGSADYYYCSGPLYAPASFPINTEITVTDNVRVRFKRPNKTGSVRLYVETQKKTMKQ